MDKLIVPKNMGRAERPNFGPAIPQGATAELTLVMVSGIPNAIDPTLPFCG